MYVPELELLIVGGVHVPIIPLLEVVGSIGAVAPLHINAGKVNEGTAAASIVTVMGTRTLSQPFED